MNEKTTNELLAEILDELRVLTVKTPDYQNLGREMRWHLAALREDRGSDEPGR